MSRIADAGAPIAAAVLAGARWALQGSANVYTDPSRGYYQPDPQLGWQYVEQGPLWLGLDSVAGLLAAAVVAFAFGAWLDRRADAEQLREGVAGRVIWALGLATLAIPIAAFVTGSLPQGARTSLPEQTVEAPDDGIDAHLTGLPAGRYVVVEGHERNVIIATVSAGGEEFEARFSGLSGAWTGDPADLRQPMEATFTAKSATADTGVSARSNHAREYLHAETHAALRVQLDALTGTEPADGGGLRIAAQGHLTFIGDEIPVALTGTLSVLDAESRGRLGLEQEHAMRVDAGFSLRIADTKLSADASDFSAEVIPIRVELILVRQ